MGEGKGGERADLGMSLRIRDGQAEGDKKPCCHNRPIKVQLSYLQVLLKESDYDKEKKGKRGRGQLNTNYPDSHAIDFLSDLHSHKHRTHNLK